MIRSINMIPLINVVFLLLIFFLVTSTIEQQENAQLHLPFSDSADPDKGARIYDPVTIVITQGFIIGINGKIVEESQFSKRLSSTLKQHIDSTLPVTVKVDQMVEAENLIALLEQMKKVGVTDIALVTQYE